MRQCSVPNCLSRNSRYAKRILKRNPSKFVCPNADMLPIWRNSDVLKGIELTRKHSICDLHFRDEDIIRYDCITLRDGTVSKLKRGLPKLVRTAVPVFCNNKTLTKPEAELKEMVAPVKNYTRIPQIRPPLILLPLELSSHNCNIDLPDPKQLLEASTLQNLPVVDQEPSEISSQNFQDLENDSAVQASEEPFTISELHKRVTEFRDDLLPNMWGVHLRIGRTLFCHINERLIVDKMVLFETSLKPTVILNKKEISMPEVHSFSEVGKLLHKVAMLRSCLGYADQQWHQNCIGYVTFEFRKYRKRCINCMQKRRAIQRTRPHKPLEEKYAELVIRYKATRVESSGLRKKVAKLEKLVKTQHKELRKEQTQKLILIVE